MVILENLLLYYYIGNKNSSNALKNDTSHNHMSNDKNILLNIIYSLHI